MANFRQKAEVQYNDFLGTIAVDRSNALLDSGTCDFFIHHSKDDNGKVVDLHENFIRAIRAYYSEDLQGFSVDIRFESMNHKMHDHTYSHISLKDMFSLFKRFEMVLKINKH